MFDASKTHAVIASLHVIKVNVSWLVIPYPV